MKSFNYKARIIIKSPELLKDQNQKFAIEAKGLKSNTKYYYRLIGINESDTATYSSYDEVKSEEFIKIDIALSKHLKDTVAAADNANFGKVSDTTAPKIGVVLNTTIGNPEVWLHYRKFRDYTWKTLAVTSTNNSFLIKLPYTAFDEIGLEYYFTLSVNQAFYSGIPRDAITAITKGSC